MIRLPFRLVRYLHCKGCGSEFHNKSPEIWGFRQSLKSDTTHSVKETLHAIKYSKIYENLTVYQRQALQFTPPEMEIESYSSAQVRSASRIKKKQQKFETFCRPCIDSQDGRTTPILPSEFNSLENIPKNSPVMHVIDAFDFPASVDPIILSRPNTTYIISRADLVLTHPNQISRLKLFAMDQVFSRANVPPSRVHVVSVAKKWGLTPVIESLSEQTYFVGKTNTGKSTLIGHISSDHTKSWPIPFKTKYPQEHSFGDRILIDTPSIPESSVDGTGVFSILKPSHIRKVLNGKMMLNKQGRYNVEPTVAKPGQIVSLGGLVAIEIPESSRGNSTHVWAVHGVAGPLVTRAFGSLDKIYEIAASQHDAHQGWSMTDATQIPPLEHQFDIDITKPLSLVIRGLGPVFLKSFGKYTEPINAKVYALPGIEVYQRGDILPWLLHRPSTRKAMLEGGKKDNIREGIESETPKVDK